MVLLLFEDFVVLNANPVYGDVRSIWLRLKSGRRRLFLLHSPRRTNDEIQPTSAGFTADPRTIFSFL
jgi:hypothetical protein